MPSEKAGLSLEAQRAFTPFNKGSKGVGKAVEEGKREAGDRGGSWQVALAANTSSSGIERPLALKT